MGHFCPHSPGDCVCNLVHPGLDDSKMSSGHDEEQIERILRDIPLGRAADSRNEVGATQQHPGSTYP